MNLIYFMLLFGYVLAECNFFTIKCDIGKLYYRDMMPNDNLTLDVTDVINDRSFCREFGTSYHIFIITVYQHVIITTKARTIVLKSFESNFDDGSIDLTEAEMCDGIVVHNLVNQSGSIDIYGSEHLYVYPYVIFYGTIPSLIIILYLQYDKYSQMLW